VIIKGNVHEGPSAVRMVRKLLGITNTSPFALSTENNRVSSNLMSFMNQKLHCVGFWMGKSVTCGGQERRKCCMYVRGVYVKCIAIFKDAILFIHDRVGIPIKSHKSGR
jgi:hypothetical protein